MSTRATYEICGTTFYCHYDGYPTGAAQRFAEMVKAMTVYCNDGRMIEDRRGGFPYAFIRGALDAEPTEGHEAHGDTEWRYTLGSAPDGVSTMIRVEERLNFSDPSKRETWAGKTYDLADWLNQVRDRDLVAEIKRIQARYPTGTMSCPGDPKTIALQSIPVIVKVVEELPYCKTPTITYSTLAEAIKIKDAMSAYSNTFKADNPNKEGYAKRARAWSDAVAGAQFENA